MTEPLSAPSQDDAVVTRFVPDRTAADLARDPSADLDQAEKWCAPAPPSWRRL